MNNKSIGFIPRAKDDIDTVVNVNEKEKLVIEEKIQEYTVDNFGIDFGIKEGSNGLEVKKDTVDNFGIDFGIKEGSNGLEVKKDTVDNFGIDFGIKEGSNGLEVKKDTVDNFGIDFGIKEESNGLEVKKDNVNNFGIKEEFNGLEVKNDNVNNDLIEEISISNNTDEEESIDVKEDEDIKIKLFKSFYDYRPINLFIGDNKIKDYEKIENCIVIEKFGEDIISVERLGFKPFYIKGEKDNLITKESNLSEYIQWLKSDMIKRYNNTISDDEFDGIKKYIIIDDESDKIELNSNEIYMTRKEALSRVSSKYEAIIDLTMNNCHIKFIDEDGNDCEIDVKGLGYEISSSIDWTELIYTKLEMLKERNIIFTGLAGNEKLNKDLKLKFNVNGNRKFESLAWEI